MVIAMDAEQLYNLTEDVVRKINKAFPDAFDAVDTLSIVISHAQVSRAVWYYKNSTIVAELKITTNAPHPCRCKDNLLCVYEYKYLISRVFANDYLTCANKFEIPVGNDAEYAYIYHIIHELSHIATANFAFGHHIRIKPHGHYFVMYLCKFFMYLFDIDYRGIKRSLLYKMFQCNQ